MRRALLAALLATASAGVLAQPAQAELCFTYGDPWQSRWCPVSEARDALLPVCVTYGSPPQQRCAG